ncbi:MAG: DUF3488 domain-containing protein [Planctomycetes bacterium]|nr:DUF3488 domain-containing protein [Planctomycetota bacterium]
MDLYRILRISIYLMVASGALAISTVERDLRWLGLVLGGGALAYWTVDSGRARPVRSWLAGLLGGVLMVQFMVPALRYYEQNLAFLLASQMAHLLVMIQVALFFTAFRATSFYSYCASSLFIVVLSGIIDHGPDLLLRLLVFLATTTWALYVHALWRGRTAFEDQAASVSRVHSGAGPKPEPGNALSERAIWQGLQFTAAVSILCLVLGFALFFAWPRLSGNMRNMFTQVFDQFRPPPSANNSDGETDRPNDLLPRLGRGLNQTIGERAVGLNDNIDLSDLSPINDDPTPAVSVQFDRPLQAVVHEEGRLYFRAGAFSIYDNNRWSRAPQGETVRPESGTNYVAFSEDRPAFLRPSGATSYRATLKMETLQGRVYVAPAPVRRLYVDALQEDEEGGLHPPGRAILHPGDSYEVEAWLPPRYGPLAGVPALTTDRRYRTWDLGMQSAVYAQQIRALAHQLTAELGSDLQRAVRLRDYLRSSGQYTYTLQLNRVPHTSDHAAEFLLGTPEQRQGHCGYFATGYVILARAVGLPARLAFGYAQTAPSHPTLNRVTFRNSDAHAWAEVYFTGYGWVPFDPTPGSSAAPLTAGTGADPLGRPAPSPEPLDSPSASSERGWVTRSWDYFLSYDGDTQEAMYGRLGENVKGTFDSLAEFFTGSNWGGLWTLAIWVSVLGLLAWGLVVLWRQQEERRNPLNKLPPRARAAVSFYNELLQVLSKRGFMRRLGQTPREFAEAVVRRGGQDLVPVLTVTSLFERVRYGGEDIGEAELNDLRQALGRLSEKLDAQEKAGASGKA